MSKKKKRYIGFGEFKEIEMLSKEEAEQDLKKSNKKKKKVVWLTHDEVDEIKKKKQLEVEKT